MRIAIPAVLLLCALALVFPAHSATKNKPLPQEGEIVFNANLLGVGATLSWGKGWLTFRGKNYPIKVEGLGLVGVGFSQVRARGRVFNLKQAKDIVGSYTEVGAGIAIVGGPKGLMAKNQKGVVIDLTAEQTGVSFNLGGGSFNITMLKQ